MRHRVQKRHFNRDTNSRKALLRNLVRSLVETGEIITTITKAKEIKRISDKLIGKASNDTVATRRALHRFFGKKDAVNTLVDSVAPAMKDRKSGFTTISKIGKRRGDNSEMARLAFVTKPENSGLSKPKAEEKEVKADKKVKAVVKKTEVKKVEKKSEVKKEEKTVKKASEPKKTNKKTVKKS